MWAGGTLFPVVLLCQFFVLAGNRFWFYILTYVTQQIILRTNIFLIVVEVLAMFFGGFLVDQITTGKKIQSSGRRLEQISDNRLSCQNTKTTNHTLI